MASEKFSSTNKTLQVEGKKLNEGFYKGAPREKQLVAYFSKAQRQERELKRKLKQGEKPFLKEVTFHRETGSTLPISQGFNEWQSEKVDDAQYIDTLYKAIKSLYSTSGAYTNQPELLDYHVTATVCSILANHPEVDVNAIVAQTDRLEVDFTDGASSKKVHFVRQGTEGKDEIVFSFNTDDTVDLKDKKYTEIKKVLERNRAKQKQEVQQKLATLKQAQKKPDTSTMEDATDASSDPATLRVEVPIENLTPRPVEVPLDSLRVRP